MASLFFDPAARAVVNYELNALLIKAGTTRANHNLSRMGRATSPAHIAEITGRSGFELETFKKGAYAIAFQAADGDHEQATAKVAELVALGHISTPRKERGLLVKGAYKRWKEGPG